MSAYLAYSYSTGLTKKEQTKIDQKTKKSWEEFSQGFVKGISFSLAAYSFCSLITSAAYAADSNVPQTAPKTPVDTGVVPPTPTPKPEFKPLTDGTKRAYIGGASTIYGVAQSGDFYLGIVFAFMLVMCVRSSLQIYNKFNKNKEWEGWKKE